MFNVTVIECWQMCELCIKKKKKKKNKFTFPQPLIKHTEKNMQTFENSTHSSSSIFHVMCYIFNH